MAADVVHWVAGSGNFNTAADWQPQRVPGAADTAMIDAAGTYTVTAGTSETVSTLAMAAGATLVVSAGTFTVSGSLAGNATVDTGAVLLVKENDGRIAGAGRLGGGAFNLANAGTVNANGTAGLTIDLGGGRMLQNSAGLIEATGAGGLTIAGGTVSNAGTMLAANGGTLTLQSGVVSLNNAGGVLSGGTWEADGSGSLLAITGGAVAHDAATIILAGGGSVFSAGDGSITNLEASLAGVNPVGTLGLDAGASFTAAQAIGDVGTIRLGGGTLTAPGLALGAGGHVSGFGTVATTGHALANAGTVEANSGTLAIAGVINGSGRLVVDAGAALAAAGGLTIAGGTIQNKGVLLAANGGTLTFQSGAVNPANTGGVLSGGTWEADGNGSVLAVTGGAVTQDKATIVLSGVGSAFRAGDGKTFTNLEASLAGVAPIGTLELLAGRSFTATNGISDFGMIRLGGGTLTAPRLAVGAGGPVSGFGTIADTRYALSNGGTIEANGGTLAVAGAIDPASSGVFRLDASSLLEIAADQGAQDKMSFVGTGGELIIDAAQIFGLNVGSAAYTGPLAQNFGTGDEILLKNVVPVGLTPVYDTATGIVQLSNGSANAASLMFDKATLGAGTFHLADDGHGHALLTHS